MKRTIRRVSQRRERAFLGLEQRAVRLPLEAKKEKRRSGSDFNIARGWRLSGYGQDLARTLSESRGCW
jgi:hypothetical protein